MADSSRVDAAEALELAQLSARVRVAEHVVYRAFPTETVLLNLTSGTYHGLNATAGRMLECVQEGATLGEAAAVLAREYGQPPERVEADVRELCAALAVRGLVELEPAPAA
jgi:Coenzyme PQQ synthesis protein D (PqqD)